jgi:glycosyltransferase involved in cell wall biosynthesis
MPKVSVIILTKNRSELLKKALISVQTQSFRDFEIVLVDDGSTDSTESVIADSKGLFENLRIIHHIESKGITVSRQEALEASKGELIAFLDDDDEWIDIHKLDKQVKYFEAHPKAVLVGGSIITSQINSFAGGFLPPVLFLAEENQGQVKVRPETDAKIRKHMLFRNCFFTSTVMLKRSVALEVDGFTNDDDDFAEDYDLWLRMGTKGEMYNFQDVFTKYTVPNYSKDRFKAFLNKQLRLIEKYKNNYPHYFFARMIIKLRLLF